MRSIREVVAQAFLRPLQDAKVKAAPAEEEPPYAASFRQSYFAETPVDLNNVKSYCIEEFPQCGPCPWLDSPDALEQIAARERAGELSAEEADVCRKWVRDGYVIIKGLFDHDYIDAAWAAYEKAVEDGLVKVEAEKVSDDDPYLGRFLNPHLAVPEFGRLLHHPSMVKWIALLTGREPVPFQTISSFKGSQQGVHSDTIHMTTYPLGYLTATWVAMEDIHPDSGPLVYYPGSHRLPYLSARAVGIAPGEFQTRGYAPYTEKYEPAIRELIRKHDLKPAYFSAQQGDILIWHANLLHGGSLRNNLQLSRKAVVCHYFVKGAVCYHDLAGEKAGAELLNYSV